MANQQNGVDVNDIFDDNLGGIDFSVFQDDQVKSDMDQKNNELAEEKEQMLMDFARLFSTERGQRVLDYLLDKTIRDPVVNPNHQNVEEYAYYRGGQNELMRRIANHINQGRKIEEQKQNEEDDE